MVYDTHPTNEAIRCENHVEEYLDMEKKLIVTVWEVIEGVRIVLLSKKRKIL
jgi:hypothetical protein